jgi:hypothetical protein
MEALYTKTIPNYSSLYNLLKIEEFNCALAYLVENKKHSDLKVSYKEHYIEVSNKAITIIVLLFVGFTNQEYKAFRSRTNLYLITFDKNLATNRSNRLNVTYYNQLLLLFLPTRLTEDEQIRRLRILNNL